MPSPLLNINKGTRPDISYPQISKPTRVPRRYYEYGLTNNFSRPFHVCQLQIHGIGLLSCKTRTYAQNKPQFRGPMILLEQFSRSPCPATLPYCPVTKTKSPFLARNTSMSFERPAAHDHSPLMNTLNNFPSSASILLLTRTRFTMLNCRHLAELQMIVSSVILSLAHIPFYSFLRIKMNCRLNKSLNRHIMPPFLPNNPCSNFKLYTMNLECTKYPLKSLLPTSNATILETQCRKK